MSNATSLTSQIDGKWFAGIDAAGIKTLDQIAAQVNSLHYQMRQKVARFAVEIGQQLMVARTLFEGDRQYGEWCALQFPWANRTALYNMRVLAEQVGAKRITAPILDELPVSAVFELVSAPDRVLELVSERVSEGNPPTVAEIRAEKSRPEAAPEPAPRPDVGREEVAPGSHSDPAPSASPKAEEKAAPVFRGTLDPALKYRAMQEIIDRPFAARIVKLMSLGNAPTTEYAYMLFGLDPNPCCYPNEFVIDSLMEVYEGICADPAEHAFLNHCLRLIEDDRDGFHS